MTKQKKKWVTPALKRLMAGGAELGGASAPDVSTGHS
jgi:hypothetical protein